MRNGSPEGEFRRYRLGPEERERAATRIGEVLAQEDCVLFAYLFGSFPEGRPFEDVDLGVLVDSARCPSGSFLDAQLRLAAKMEREIRLPVDVVVLNDAPLGLRMAALRGRLVYSHDENMRLRFVERTALQAMDTAYLRRQSLRDLLSPSRFR